MATCGYRMCFHGAFGSQAKAAAKKESKGSAAVILKRKIRGQTRWIVATRKESA